MTKSTRERTKGILLSFLLVQIGMGSGCVTSMEPVSEIDDTGEISIEVALGDTVRVLTKYGERPTIEVTEVGAEALVGNGRRILYADMVFVERLTASPVETAAYLLVIIPGVGLMREIATLGP